MNHHHRETDHTIQYYIQYVSSWFYHNVLHTETTVVLLKFVVFVILLSLLVYQKYHYFAVGVIFIICAWSYLYLSDDGATTDTTTGISEWVNYLTNIKSSVELARRVDKDDLTIGIPLVKEGFSIGMPKIIQGDDSGKDHRRSNKFIEEDSRDFTEKYFNSKKCGIGSGIGGITMFGSNELIGGQRQVALSGVYNFEANYVVNAAAQNTDANNLARSKRYKYFKDCVYDPVRRSVNNSASDDFRTIKRTIYTNTIEKIIDIEKVLARFDTSILFNTYNDPTSDYSKRITLGPPPSSSGASVEYQSLITGNTNNDKLRRIQTLTGDDDKSDGTYSELLTKINRDRNMKPMVKQRHLEVYTKVYEFRKKLDSILANMRAQTKDDASLMYTVRINESVIQELRMILSYLAIMRRTKEIIDFEEECRIYSDISTAVTSAAGGANGTLEVIAIPTGSTNKPKIIGANNIFKIPIEDETYNSKDEKRYLYGITYYFDKWNSKPSGTS